MPNLVEIIKRAAVEAVAASSPCELVFGIVDSPDPLKITVEQRLTLSEEHLILSTLVQEFEIEMTVEHFTENDAFLNTLHGHSPTAPPVTFDSTHKHEYKGRKKWTVHLGLTAGEKVILIRMQGGQKYLVLDRVR